MGSPDSLPAPPPALKLDQETDKTPTNEAGRMVDLLEKVRMYIKSLILFLPWYILGFKPIVFPQLDLSSESCSSGYDSNDVTAAHIDEKQQDFNV